MKRRDFIATLGSISAALAGTKKAGAAPQTKKGAGKAKEFFGVLCDVSRCIGCRACEVACAKANRLPYVPDVTKDGALAKQRKTSFEQRTVVNRFKTSKGPVYVKTQCMHCWQPACASACLTNAMEKHHEGPVTWNGDKCMGCRYCMVACPFAIPKFEYDSPNPRIQKCTMCWERLEKGQTPACVEVCPVNALQFGLRRTVMETARARIYAHPDKYVHAIYGEREVGGTGWIYISHVPFEEIGFRTDLGDRPYPEYATGFLYGVPVVFLVGPTLLIGLHQLSKRSGEVARGAAATPAVARRAVDAASDDQRAED